MTAYALRPAVAADAERMGAVTAEGFESYRSLAPAGWDPPSTAREVARVRELLGDEDVWYLVAERGGELVGHVGFMPAARAHHAVDDPALAHFRQLFVRRAHWGAGLATTLHAAALEEAAARGFAAMRLFTPAGQARARRFYEREGWVLAEPPAHDEHIGMVIAVYRHSLAR